MDLILVRHGETDANREGILMGSSEGPTLNARGRSQATNVAEALKREHSFHLYTSPARRAKETAGIISKTFNTPLTVVDDLTEIDVGCLEGLTHTEVSHNYPSYMAAWERDAATCIHPGGETMQDLQDRAWRTIEHFSAVHADDTVVAVSHCFTILATLARVLDMPLRHFRRVRLDLGAMVRLELNPGKSEVVSSNENWHLRTHTRGPYDT